MAELKAEGKVRHIGVSNFDVLQMKRAQEIAPVESLQPPYSMLSREIEDEIPPYCQENGIAVIVYSPMRAASQGKRPRAGKEPTQGTTGAPRSASRSRHLIAIRVVEFSREIGNVTASPLRGYRWTSDTGVRSIVVDAAGQVDALRGATEWTKRADEIERHEAKP